MDEMSVEYVLAAMEDIEQEKPLSGEHAPDGRYVWVERWNALKNYLRRWNKSKSLI